MIIAEDKGFMEIFKVANLSALIVFSNPSSNTQWLTLTNSLKLNLSS